MDANEWEHTWQHSVQAVAVQCKVKKNGGNYQGFVYDQDNDRWLIVNGENNGTGVEEAIEETKSFAERLIGEIKRKQTPKTPNPTDAKPTENGKAEAEIGKVLERLKRLEETINGNGQAMNNNGHNGVVMDNGMERKMNELRHKAADTLTCTDESKEIEEIKRRVMGRGIYVYPAYLGPGAHSDAKCWVRYRELFSRLARLTKKPWKATIQAVVFYDPEKRKKEVAKASKRFSSRVDAYRWLEKESVAIEESNEVWVRKLPEMK
jgi:hypothetical protein